MTIENDDSHTSSDFLSLRAADGVTIDFYWRHNDGTSVTRASVNSNPLDMDFIHRDIHDRSYKKGYHTLNTCALQAAQCWF